MKRYWLVIVLLCAAVFVAGSCDSSAVAGESSVMRGKVTDLTGLSVAGAEVFVYDSTNTRRPADFISPKTGPDGRYTLELPPGKYWAVARVRQGEKFGPLQPGTRHSGEPTAIEPAVAGMIEQDFSVADIREAARSRLKPREDFVKVSGRVVDSSGAPVAMAYVMAYRGKQLRQLPDYVSAWSDESGRYSLYLPPGTYFLGTATEFPPGGTVPSGRELVVAPGKIDIAIDVEITLK
jgi:hypothetical protein